MESLAINPDDIDVEVVTATKDGRPLSYRLSTWDDQLKQQLIPLAEKGKTVSFTIEPLRFEGKLQSERSERQSRSRSAQETFLVNLRLAGTEPARIPNRDG